MKTSYREFTKQAKITKSIQFELVPQGRTRETMVEKRFEEQDEKFRELIDDASPYIDDTVRGIASAALKTLALTFSEDTVEEDIKKAAEKATAGATKSMYGMSVANINSAKFISDVLPKHIQEMSIPAEEKAEAMELVEKLKGKTGLMKSFLITRITALSTWMPQRVAENFETYKRNIAVISRLLESELGDLLRLEYENIDTFSDIENYRNYLAQDDIDAYNRVINGVVSESGIVKKGVRMLVNEYNLQNKGHSLPMPKELYKQILVPQAKAFVVRSVNTDDELKEIVDIAKESSERAGKSIVNAVETTLSDGIVVPYNKLHTLSHIVFGDHNVIPSAIRQNAFEELQDALQNAENKRARSAIMKSIDNIDKVLMKKEWTLSEIEDELNGESVAKDFKSALTNLYLYAKGMHSSVVFPVEGLRENEDALMALKDYFDAWTEFRDALNIIRRRSIEKGDNALYATMEDVLSELRSMAKAEGMAVAYVTRKPKDVAKKEIATMGSARRTDSQWIRPDGKIDVNTHTILKRDGKYYFFILATGTKPTLLAGDSDVMAFAQKKAQNALQFLPKVTFSNAKKYFEENPNEDVFVISDKVSRPIQITRALYDIKEKNLYTTGALKDGIVTQEEFEANLYQILSFYADFISVYEEYQYFDIKLKDLHEYKESGSFFEDVNAGNVATMWIQCDAQKIDDMVERGEALCFEIHSRNLYTPKEKKTAYDQLLIAALEDENSDVFLNSNPKIFSRKASIKKPIVHKSGSILVNKNDVNGKKIPAAIYEELYRYFNNKTGMYMTDLSKEAKDYISSGRVVRFKATEDIVKDKRYTEDKWFVAFSVTKNRRVASSTKGLNNRIRETISERNVITIIRSETDLAYYMITDPNGAVLEESSLNVIDGCNYWEILKNVSDTRKEEKSKDWKYGRTVMDQRDAYFAKAISVIVRKVIEYDAIVLMEHIAAEVKNKFDAMDNSAMKKFDSMLVARLSDLFFLDAKAGEPGSVTNPYQLCENNGNAFQDGIVFFVSPAYTGNVDRETGFVNVFNFNGTATVSAKNMFLSKFDSITYDREANRFVFVFDYDNFPTKTNLKETKWTVLAGGPRVVFNNEHKYNTFVPESASKVEATLESRGYDANTDYAKVAFDTGLVGEDANALFAMFQYAVSGILKKCDAQPKSYVSPVTGKVVAYNSNAALNLTKKFRFLQSQTDAKTKETWLEHIAD